MLENVILNLKMSFQYENTKNKAIKNLNLKLKVTK